MSTERVALVTGASRGIGAESAVMLARDGYDIALAARSTAALDDVAARCAAHGRRTLVVPTDVTVEEEVRAMVQRTTEQLGRLDVLVNNAGGSNFAVPVTEVRSSGWEKLFRLNVTQAFWALQEAGRIMLAQGEGSVVNVASLAAVGPAPRMAPYGAAKAALVSLTKTTAAEWSPSGVRVNAVAPGYVRTRLTEWATGDPGIEGALAAGTLMGRLGEPEEIAEVVAFVAGRRASYLTGQVIVVDGGMGVPHSP